MPHLKFKTEQNLISQGYKNIVGCDEVGRGCLAGPVVAAAVVLDPQHVQSNSWYKQVRDSKKLTPTQRERLAELLREHSIAWGMGLVSSDHIDQINIHNASLLAMKRAIAALHSTFALSEPTHIMVDGRFTVPHVTHSQQAIVGGDDSVLSISAASIIAKVYRDRLMVKLHKRFPEYGHDQHKGYATVSHRNAIKQYGLSSVHRVTFCGNIL